MKATEFHGLGNIRVDDVPEPTIQYPHDMDLHFVRGSFGGMDSGTILGNLIMRYMVVATCALALAVAFGSVGHASAGGTDKAFLQQAISDGSYDFQLAQFEVKSVNAYVRDYANVMVADDRALDDQLETLAKARDVQVKSAQGGMVHPTAAPLVNQPPDEAKLLSKPPYDPASYFKDSIADDEKAIALYERESKGGTDAQVRGVASRELPTLWNHLQLAEKDAKIIASLPKSGGSQ